MSVFEDVKISWKGKEYTVPSDQVMKLIAKIEDCVSLQEILSTGGPRLTKLSMSFYIALTTAGCEVSHEQVYESMFGDGGKEAISEAVSGLLLMMIPPKTYQPDTEKQAEPSKKKPGKKRKKKAKAP